MAVDFDVRRDSARRVATRTMNGRWPGDRALGKEYDALHRWVRAAGFRTGKWYFRSLGDMSESGPGRWEVGIELLGRKAVRGGGGVAIKTFPASTIVAVKFDPGKVSPGLVYNSIGGWMRWSGRAKGFKQNGPWREAYSGNPWKSKKAWASTEIQAPIKK